MPTEENKGTDDNTPAEQRLGAFLEGADEALADVADADIDIDAAQAAQLRDLLGDDIVWAEPPEGLEDLIVRDIAEAAAPNVVSLEGHREKKRFSLAARTITFASGIAAALLLVVGISFVRGGGDYTVDLASTDLAPGVTGEVTIENTPSGVSIELDISGLPPAPDGFYYQAWMKGENGLVTVGTFHAREGGDDIVLWSGVSVDDYPTLTVTIQQEGEGAASSGQVLLTADLTEPE